MTLPFSLIFLGWPPLKSHFFSYGPPPNPTRPPYLIKNERSLKSPRICFQGTKYEIYREHVAYLHSILWRRARLWLELFASTVGSFLSRISYLLSYVFLRRCRSFTSRKLNMGVARGGGYWDARDPPFCKPFLSKQPTSGDKNYMTIW